MAAEILAGIGLGMQVLGGVLGSRSARRQRREQRRQQELEKRSEAVKIQMARRQAYRERRIREASLLNTAAQTGTMDSSGLSGAMSGLGAIYGNTNSQIAYGQGVAGSMSGSLQRQANFQNQAAMYGQLGAFGGTLFSLAGGFDAFGQTSATTTTSAPQEVGVITDQNFWNTSTGTA